MKTAVLMAFLLTPLSWAMAQGHGHGGTPACADGALACASSASPFFAPDGTLWLVWAAGDRVAAARSTDKGAHFGDPVRITPEPAKLDTGPDSRPQIVVDAAGRITVAYAVFRDQYWNGAVFAAHSTDGGTHFSTPAPVTVGSPSQRFQGMALDSDGAIFAAWLDKRNGAAAKARGEAYPGAALAFAWSGGDGFAPARIAADNTCECCRLGIGFAGPGRPVVVFRNVFGGTIRDHAMIVFQDRTTPGPLRRVSEDQWVLDGCPHHGPSLAVSPSGTLHTAWFSGGGVRRGLFHARSTDEGAHFSAPMPVGEPGRQNSRPTLAALRSTIFLAWKSFDGEQTEVRLMVSHDDGQSWGEPRTIAATRDESDHPLLIGDGTAMYLSWLTRKDGYRLILLGGVS